MPNLQSLSRILGRLQQLDIIYEPALCSRVRWRHSQCKLCAEGCVSGAVHLSPEFKLDEDRCTNCGLCISRCPNGVFWSRKRGDQAIAEEMRDVFPRNGSRSVAFGCYQAQRDDKSDILLPCLGRLTEDLLVASFALGADRVEIRWPECQGCAREKTLSHVGGVLSLGRRLAAMVGMGEDCIQMNKVSKPFAPRPAATSLSRRDFFRRLRAESTQTVAALLPGLTDNRLSTPWAHFVGIKRAYLLKLVRGFPKPNSVRTERGELPFAELEIGPGCVGCPVCSTLCPTGALERLETTEGADIYFRPDICTGCLICQEACLFRAISVSPTVDLLNLATGEVRRLIHLDRKSCRECASEFLGGEEEICPACRVERSQGASTLARR